MACRLSLRNELRPESTYETVLNLFQAIIGSLLPVLGRLPLTTRSILWYATGPKESLELWPNICGAFPNVAPLNNWTAPVSGPRTLASAFSIRGTEEVGGTDFSTSQFRLGG